MRKNDSEVALTLIELLVVLAVVSALTALLIPSAFGALASANQAKCASNQRQIGLALLSYANDHDGEFPPTTHTTGSFRKDRSWIFEIAEHLDNVDEVRVCPADPPKRQRDIISRNATSYVLNDQVFDAYEFNRVLKMPYPSKTILLFILSEGRIPSVTRDHIHGGEWTSWSAILNDIEPDRHRVGARSPNRTKGTSNYLFADGHVETIRAADFKVRVESGENPAAVPLRP